MGTKKLIRFDWAIKYILRNKANFDVLEGFLSSLLKEEIKVEDILECESNQEQENRKFNREYLKCRDGKCRPIIVEIQNQREVDYLQKLLWGTSKVIVESLDLGYSYSEVVKVISISILYHTVRLDGKENTDFIYYGTTEMLGLHTKKPLIVHGKRVIGEEVADITSSNVFPECYMIYVEKFEDMIRGDIDEWIYFFKYGKIQEDFKAPGILLAASKLSYLAMGDKDRRTYEDYMMHLARERDILETAKEDGRIEGRAKVRAESEQARIEKGRIEETRSIAKNLIDIGMQLADISKVTGLSVQEIEKLK